MTQLPPAVRTALGLPSGCLLALVVATTAAAQDQRVVREPVIPPACVTLDAQLVPVGDSTLADPDERRLDTPRIQRALDGCAAGRAVVLRATEKQRAFVSGPIRLRAGVALVIDSGVTLFASRDPRVYDVQPGACGTVDRSGKGCRALISGEKVRGAAVMGPGTIDGRGWATLLGQRSSWWGLAEEARASLALHQNNPRLLQLTRSDEFTLYRVMLKNAPMFHVVFDRGTGFTAWGVVIDTPDHARNTDGIDPVSATNVTITRSWIRTGDDNVAIKAGNSGPTSQVTVSHSHFYGGHGMSIGSETNGGVRAVRVENLSIDGADNGLRIKSNAARGGLVEDVEYRDVCIRATKNPIYMDTHYSASAETKGTLVPLFRGIVLRDVRVLGGGRLVLEGYDAARPLGIALHNVVFDSAAKMKVRASHAELTLESPNSPSIGGEGVRVTSLAAQGPAPSCEGKFPPMPASAASVGTSATAPLAGPSTVVVDARHAGGEGELVAGAPVYRTLGAALAALPPNGGARVTILLRRGRYREKLTIDRPRVTLRGESADSTVLTYDAAAETPSPGGGTYGTRGSFTLRVVAPDFRAESLTIENAWDYAANAAKANDDPTKVRNGTQGVALMLDTGSDRASFENVRILGNQDTLFPNAGRSFFHRCTIAGSVDFIFGAGRAVFEDCDIVSRDRGSATNNGYVTAASTDVDQPFGFLFLRSRLRKERPAMAPGTVTLGRPWHPFADPRAVASVAFIECWMDDHIGAKGWDRMSSIDSTGTRVWYEPASARLFEYRSSGPGAVASPSRRVLTPAQAAQYTVAKVLGDWEPPR